MADELVSRNIENEINNLHLPIFYAACSVAKQDNLAERYRQLILVYSGNRGWFLAKLGNGNVISLAELGGEGMKPFIWEISNGGVWTARYFDTNRKLLQNQRFAYTQSFSLNKSDDDGEKRPSCASVDW